MIDHCCNMRTSQRGAKFESFQNQRTNPINVYKTFVQVFIFKIKKIQPAWNMCFHTFVWRILVTLGKHIPTWDHKFTVQTN